MQNKNIIIIETSLSRIFIATIKKNKILSKCINTPKSIEQELNSLIEKLIIETKLKFSDIDLFFISLGPGSFTGIRLGISVAKALALSLNARIIGFSNFEIIYSQFLINHKDQNTKKVEVIIKGPGNEFFKKVFSSGKPGIKNYLITEQQLIYPNRNTKTCLVGNFINHMNLKNYFFCIPKEEGYLETIRKIVSNLSKVKFKEPIPIYIKEHYAKKRNRKNL